MPNSEMTNEVRWKQPTGSSKRKRKQSIKRNIVAEDELKKDSVKSSKADKTCSKKLKTEKEKAAEEPDEGNTERDNANDELPIEGEKKTNCIKGEDSSNASAEKNASEKQKCKLENVEISKCSSAKEQCQNCKFCSEHRITKQDSDESNSKRTKKKFSCEICAKEGSPKVYTSSEKHKHHMVTVHEISQEAKRFECTECPETVWFPTKSKITYHLGTKHPGIIKFICEICTETFKLKANYKNHMKTHNIVVQKKFSCDICNGTFVNKAGFEAHRKRFPGPHIKQSCSHCGFSFSREKHLINHRCKTLLLEEAAARAKSTSQIEKAVNLQEAEDPLKLPSDGVGNAAGNPQICPAKKSTDSEFRQKKSSSDSQVNKRVVLHRILPRRGQDQNACRSVQTQNQNIPESVVVQAFREIESGTFIAAATADPEQQFIVRDINGHLVQGNQILQLDVNDVQSGEESQLYLADWNIVAPYVIREKSP